LVWGLNSLPTAGRLSRVLKKISPSGKFLKGFFLTLNIGR